MFEVSPLISSRWPGSQAVSVEDCVRDWIGATKTDAAYPDGLCDWPDFGPGNEARKTNGKAQETILPHRGPVQASRLTSVYQLVMRRIEVDDVHGKAIP